MLLVSIGPICVWLLISAAIYTGLWFGFIQRFGTPGIVLFNLGLSVILSPGLLMGGHGALPFPGGLVFLIVDLGEQSQAFPSLNFMMWMLTFLIFGVYSWYLKNSDTNS